MGIKHLNYFLKENASDSIHLCNLSEFSGKIFAVDISIYLYRFAGEDCLIENIYLMLSIFRHYNIIPLFVFEGKPPVEKKNLLKKRKNDKIQALEEFNKLDKILQSENMDYSERQDLLYNMDLLKKTFATISKNDIERVKDLIRAFGATYYDAPGEADELCAMLTIQGKVWACMSEDMDMFVYGCPRVIRYFSLLNHTAVLYDLKGILENLGINQYEFRQICVLSGTDYNIENKELNSLNNVLKLFKKFYKAKTKGELENTDFYIWLNVNYPNIIHNYDTLNQRMKK